MKKIIGLLLGFILTLSVCAQAPSGFSYQAVLRNNNGEILANQNAVLRISLTSSDGSTTYYEETHNITTNAQGIVNVIVGHGTVINGAFSVVPWKNDQIALKIDLKVDGAQDFSAIGNQPLQTVPYSLFAIDAVTIDWLGELATAPQSPLKNQAFYSTTDKKSYVWDGDSWETMAVDGLQGPAGVGLTLKGSWNSSESYVEGDYVFDESYSTVGVNSMWICQSDVGPTSSRPKDDLTHWVEFEAPAGPQGPSGLNGISLQWVGISSTAPDSPTINQAYYNSTDKTSYVWDGDSWEILAKDGEPGPSGMDIPGTAGQILVHNGADWTASSKITVSADTVGIGTQTPISKLVVQSDASALPEDPIFEVKNKDGKVVLGVYNEGVRVYVADGSIKGGFAVGGLSTQGKGEVEYLRITPDSSRIYIDTSSAKGVKGGFAVGGLSTQGKSLPYELFRVTKDSTRIYIADDAAKGGFAVGGLSTQGKTTRTNFFDVTINASDTLNPSKNKVLWYPKKNAFLAGRVLVEKPDSVGENSFAVGFESKSKGKYSQALGYQAIARGDYSTAIGKNAVADTVNTFAFGEGAKALANHSYAFGSGAIAQGLGSYAFGAEGRDASGNPTGIITKASGDYSLAIGYGALASGNYSVSLGYNCTASGSSSFAAGHNSSCTDESSISLGYGNQATRVGAVAVGVNNISGGKYSFTSGESNQAWNDKTVAMGWLNVVTAPCAIALGNNCSASGWRSFAVGYNSVAGGAYHTTQYTGPTMALGKSVKVYGPNSFGCGYNTTIYGYNAFCSGYYTSAQSYLSAVFGRFNEISGDTINWVATDPLFVIGNGASSSSRSNAVTVLKNGNVGIGTSSPGDYRLYVSGNAYTSGTWGSSDIRWKKNIEPIGDALSKIVHLSGVRYDWRTDEFPDMKFDTKTHIGVIAQDVEKIFPELVNTDNNGFKAVAYDKHYRPF